MIYFVLYQNGNLRYGTDLAKIRASVSPQETELEVHCVNNPPPAAPAPAPAPTPTP